MAEIKIPRFKYNPPAAEDCFRQLSEMSYKSPIETIQRGFRVQMEDNIMEAIHSYGIDVDRDELVKALKYDREQYEKGFIDGCKLDTNAIKSKFAEDLLSEIKKEAHNKAVHSQIKEIQSYITLRDLDGIIQKYINKYYEEGKKI